MRMSMKSIGVWWLDLLRLLLSSLSDSGATFSRPIVKSLSPLLKMKSHLTSTVGLLERMALGPEIWNYKQHMSPRWYIQNFYMHAARMIHLSYHDGEHYNSVRSKDDDCSGPAKPIVIKGDADLSANSKQPKVAATKSKHDGVGKVMHVESIALVKYGSGCKDASKVEQALKEACGDVDAAIEILTAEQESVDPQISHDELGHMLKNSYDKDSEQHKLKVEENACHPDSSDKLNEKIHKKSPQPEQKISRNKACPCGSKKKYKSCCGSVAGKSSGRFPIDQIVEHMKSGKDRKQGRKGGSTDEGQPDLGALCI